MSLVKLFSFTMKNLWVIKALHVGRTVPTRLRCPTAISRSFANSPPIKPEEKPVDSKEAIDFVKTMAWVGPKASPVPENKNCLMMDNEKALVKVDPNDVKASEFLSRFYDLQVKYFRDMARVHKTAMKRIKKLKRQWLKFFEN